MSTWNLGYNRGLLGSLHPNTAFAEPRPPGSPPPPDRSSSGWWWTETDQTTCHLQLHQSRAVSPSLISCNAQSIKDNSCQSGIVYQTKSNDSKKHITAECIKADLSESHINFLKNFFTTLSQINNNENRCGMTPTACSISADWLADRFSRPLTSACKKTHKYRFVYSGRFNYIKHNFEIVLTKLNNYQIQDSRIYQFIFDNLMI